MQKKYMSFFVCLVLLFSMLGCASISGGAKQGTREGVRDGVSGMFAGGNGGSSGGYSSSGSSAPERNYSGESQSMPWPSDSEWGRYGLSGLRQPSGTTVTGVALYQGQFHVGLINGGRPAFENLVNQIEGMSGAEIITDINAADGRMVGYRLSGGSVQISCNFVDGDITIIAAK